MNENPDVNVSPTQPPAEQPVIEPVKAPALPYTIKASFKEYAKHLNKGALVAAAGLSVFFFVKFGVLIGILSVIGLVILIGIILFLLTNRTITLKPDVIEYRNGFGKTRAIQYQDIEGIKVFLNYVEPSFGAFPRVLIAIKGNSPLSLLAVYWPVEELDKLLAVLNDKKLSIEYYDQPVSYGAISKEFPNYVSPIERYPGRTVAITVVATLVVIAAVVVVAMLVAG